MFTVPMKFQKLLIVYIAGATGTCYAQSQISYSHCSLNEQSKNTLQFEEAVATRKIPVIEQLALLSDTDLQRCLETSTDIELMALTIFDLSRHTNLALARKAKALADRFNLGSYIDAEMKSGDSDRREKAEELLLRIPSHQATKVINQLTLPDSEKHSLKQTIANGRRKVLIPTDSNQGDRYYVKTSWDIHNGAVVQCLTQLFYNGLLAKHTAQQEYEKMQKLNGQRWVYWYSKDWAIQIADAITECGGQSSFVKGPESN